MYKFSNSLGELSDGPRADKPLMVLQIVSLWGACCKYRDKQIEYTACWQLFIHY